MGFWSAVFEHLVSHALSLVLDWAIEYYFSKKHN